MDSEGLGSRPISRMFAGGPVQGSCVEQQDHRWQGQTPGLKGMKELGWPALGYPWAWGQPYCDLVLACHTTLGTGLGIWPCLHLFPLLPCCAPGPCLLAPLRTCSLLVVHGLTNLQVPVGLALVRGLAYVKQSSRHPCDGPVLPFVLLFLFRAPFTPSQQVPCRTLSLRSPLAPDDCQRL